MRRLLSALVLKILGWKVEGDYPHELNKLVIVVFHHTSNWDFPMGLLLRRKERFNANFVGKSSLFRAPHGFIFRWLGGYPVERDPAKKKFSLTESIVDLYNREEQLTITFTPEGTRSKVRKLKTGAWTIAKNAAVPILFIDFDFSTKTFRISKPHMASPSYKEEFEKMKSFFGNSKGLHPDLSFDFEDHEMDLDSY